MSEEIKKSKKFSRRKFLVRGGVVLGGTAAVVYFSRTPIRRKIYKVGSTIDLPTILTDDVPTFWFEVLPDNTVLLKSPKAEMGQGIFTGFQLMAAEELDVTPENIRVVPGATGNSSVDMTGTGGSNSTYSLFDPIREVSATMREMLKLVAAKKWNVNAGDISTENGTLSHGDESMTYAEVVGEYVGEWEIPETPELRPRKNFKYIGTEVPRSDLEPKVMGEPLFGLDQELEGMVHAMLVESPYIEGSIKTLDSSASEKVPGVLKIVHEEGLTAVVAENRYSAEKGYNALKIEWDVPKVWEQKDIDELVSVKDASSVRVQKDGNFGRALKNAENKVVSEFRTPLGVHAHMEPNGAIGHHQGDKITVICGTQMSGNMRMLLASEFGVDAENVDVRVQFLGGGFGRRCFKDSAAEAVRLSKIMGKPVSLFGDREQEFQNGYFRPNTHHILQGTFDENGNLDGIEHKFATGDMYLTNLPVPGLPALLAADIISAGHGVSLHYTVKNRNAEIYQRYLPFQTGIWRGVGQFANTFAKESFMDELAEKTGKDPIDFRIDYLKGEEEELRRFRLALEAVRSKSNWNKPKQEGIGRGVAMSEDRGTIVAAVIEVQEIEGRIRVTKVTHATDPGVAVNPGGIRAQVEGCIMMGISASLYEGTYVKKGKFSATNYHQYPMATLADTPEIDVIILENSDRMTGIGEPPIAPIAPAIANALYDLRGERKRTIPLLG